MGQRGNFKGTWGHLRRHREYFRGHRGHFKGNGGILREV